MINYYGYDSAIQTLYSKQRVRSSARNRALLIIHGHLNDPETARSLLRAFWSQYNNDCAIYSHVNRISRLVGAFDLLAQSTQKALKSNPLVAHFHYDLRSSLPGRSTCEILSQYLDAIDESALSRLITANIDDPFNIIDQELKAKGGATIPWRNCIRLGNFLVFARRFENAERAYRRAINQASDCAIGYSNLSFVLKLQGRARESHLAMAQSYFIQHRFNLAADEYAYAVLLGEKSVEICEQLARSYLLERRFAETIAVCAEASIEKETTELYTLWIHALQAVNQIDLALEIAERALCAFPDNHYFRFQARLILPVIYECENEIHRHRARFKEALDLWTFKCCDDNTCVSSNAMNDINATNFYLAYQGQNDTDIQKQYGGLLHRIMAATYPYLADLPAGRRRANRGRIRIGYISAFCGWHTVGKLFFGWIDHHDSRRFEVYIYHLGGEADFLSSKFEDAATKFVHLHGASLQKACELVRADELDVLVYLEVGMDTRVAKMAAFRLAPVQCLAWGHPVTSGLPTMDYFISSEMMEPPDGQDHYSEVLVKLPNIGICVPQPPKPASNKSRSDFGLLEDCTVYVFPHSLFKALPQYDKVFPLIAKQNMNSEFVFIERATHSVDVARGFRTRIAEAFKKYDLDPERHIRFVPTLSTQDFLKLLSLADVYLDSFAWSGGMTTLEAIGCMLPVVTVPGEFMRGRHAFGCLKRLGAMETVAQSIEGYVDIAARLGLDPQWREHIKRTQWRRLDHLYSDTDCIAALEEFYRSVVNR